MSSLLLTLRLMNVDTGEDVAIKLEELRSRHPQLKHELNVYRVMEWGCKCNN